MTRTDWLGVVAAFALCFGVAAIGGGITAPAIPTWHTHLQKPSWNPPNWLFGPVWTALYTMMATATGVIWVRRRSTSVTVPLAAFAVQLALNLAWSILFFGLHRLDLASWDILALDVAIMVTLFLFWQRSRAAGLLLLPYLAWTIFASFLCWEIWHLNG